jgi:hypothetical protein
MIGIAAVLLTMAACGSEPVRSRPTGTPPSTVDPCTLLTDAEVTTHLGGTQATHKTDDLAGVGRGCRWDTQGSDASVSVLLNQAPLPDKDTTSAKRTVDVSGKPGYVQADDGRYCLVYISGGQTWFQFTSQSAKKGLPDPLPKTYECDRSVPVMAKVLSKLGW